METNRNERDGSCPPKKKKKKWAGSNEKPPVRAVYAAQAAQDTKAAQSVQEKPDYRTEACFTSFACQSCGREVHPEGAGSKHRNHCPYCLCSLHVDQEPGDRASDCHGLMEPAAVWVQGNGEWSIIHRCKSCGKLSSNRVLADDNPIALMSLAVRPLANPPFPLRFLEDYLREREKGGGQ